MNENVLVPDGITPVVGWRGWEFTDGVLTSQLYAHTWTPRQPASCACAPANGSYALFRMALLGGRGRSHVRHGGSTYDQLKTEHFVQVGQVRLVLPQAMPEIREDAPAEYCNCGFHATKHITEAAKYGTIIGRVALWGRVVVHESGWRGQYAYPQAFYVADNEYGRLREQLEVFGVPVMKRSVLNGLPAVEAPLAASNECARCHHDRYMHGSRKFGCLKCPIKYGGFLAMRVKPSCEFAEAEAVA